MNILIPDSWLRECLETDATPQQIKDCLSLCGPSVEKVNKVGNDFIYEIEITSNRVDMVSVVGIAREAAAILPRFGLKAKLKPFYSSSDPSADGESRSSRQARTSTLPMAVSDPQKICNRIMGIVMEVDTMKQSPMYVKERLEKSGVRSLNNLVDITNYVMLELGHPCHVFDYDRIKTHKFFLRFAMKNEPIITLDNKKYLLSDEDVIIDDGTGRVIDLPGIMGTENSVVNQKTKKIFFFIESNNPLYIRKTSMRYGIRTMAAAINEKHPDPKLVKTALFRGIELYQKLAGGKVAGEIIDIYPNKPKPVTIKTTVEFINERLGIKLKKEEITNILQSLGFNSQLTTHNSQLIITPPSFRQFDVTIPEDIVEEVARIYGYHNLPSRLMSGDIPITEKANNLETEEQIKLILKYLGYTEVYNYSFISRTLIEKSGLKTTNHLKVANPLTEEIEYMRISLVPSMLDTVFKNQPYSDNLQLFELANVYLTPQEKEAVKTPSRWRGNDLDSWNGGGTKTTVNGLPNEIPLLAITNQKDFYELKGLVETLLAELGVTDFTTDPEVSPASTWSHFWHPQQTISLNKNGKNLGYLGKIHPQLANAFQIKNDLFLAVLNVELLAQIANPSKKYSPIPLYPPVIEDLTIQCLPQTYIGPIISQIYRTSSLIRNVYLQGRYKNAVTLRITYQHEKRNVTNDEVKSIRLQVLQNLKEKFKARLKE